MFCLPAETRHPLSSPGAWCCPDNWPTCAPSRSRSFSLSLFHPLLFTAEQDILFSVIANGQPMSLHVWFIHILDKCLPLSLPLAPSLCLCSTALSVYRSFFLRLLYILPVADSSLAVIFQNMYEDKYICECALGGGYLSTSH